MTRILLLALLATGLLICAPIVRAQGTAPAIACYADRHDNQAHKKKLWDGYEISLGPVRNGEAEESCTAAIYRADGKVVYRATGFNVVFDAQNTGLDFDGDGNPEVVFKTDTGGGNHCCWAYNVISLAPKPRKLFDIAQTGAVQFEHDAAGKMVIWQRLPGPYGFTSMAANPFAEKVWRVRDGKLVDATPEFSSRIFSDQNEDFRTWAAVLTDERLQKLTTAPDPYDSEEVVSALLSKALQLVFCHRFEEAAKELDLCPAASRAKMKEDFARGIREEYPEFATLLANQAH